MRKRFINTFKEHNVQANIEAVESAPRYMAGFSSRYDYEAAQQEAVARADDLESAAVGTVTSAIRRVAAVGQLSPKNVRQILNTLASNMKAQGFCDQDIELIDTASEVVG